MSWNLSGERKCNDQELIQEDNLPRSDRGQLDPASHSAPKAQEGANAEAVRWARVVALRAAVKEGSYRVSALDVAEGMLRFAERHHTTGWQMYSA